MIITIFHSSISQKEPSEKKQQTKKNHNELKIIFHFPIENDRPVELCIGNVVGSITVHSYHT